MKSSKKWRLAGEWCTHCNKEPLHETKLHVYAEYLSGLCLSLVIVFCMGGSKGSIVL